MEWFDGVFLASIDLTASAAIIFVVAMALAGLILVSSTVMFIFYLLATAQRIVRRKR